MRRALPILALLGLPAAAYARWPMTYLSTDGPAATPTAHLGWGLLGLSVFVVVFIALAVLIGIWWKRSDGPYDSLGRPVVTRGRNGLPWIVIGVSVSTVLLFGSAVWTFFTLAAVAAPPGNPKLTLDVTGHQWWWEVKYREYGQPARTFLTANEIHIPVGEPVRVRLIGVDVIHSFWVPQLAGKTDVIPGQTNIAWLEARRPGVYRGQCTEYCGLQHAHMALQVVAQSPQQFKAWWDHQLADAAPPTAGKAQQGEQVFESRCSICHTVRGLPGNHGILGPDLTHLMSRRMIGAGMLPNTTGNLAAWVTDAQSIKPGIDMPAESMTPQQLLNLLAYLKTLR